MAQERKEIDLTLPGRPDLWRSARAPPHARRWKGSGAVEAESIVKAKRVNPLRLQQMRMLP